MLSKAANRTRFDSVDGQRPAMDAPAEPRALVLVVIAQMPHQVTGLAVGDGPMMCDARDAPQRVIRIVARRINLADNRVLGPRYRSERSHRGTNSVTAILTAHRLQRPRWIR